jgi:hypothetical protein
VDHVQISVLQLYRHHFQGDAQLVFAEEEQSLVLIARRWREVEDQTAILDDVLASRAFDSVPGC